MKQKDPKEGFHGELNLNAGSFNYKKQVQQLKVEMTKVKALISASTEKAYKDGNGDNF